MASSRPSSLASSFSNSRILPQLPEILWNDHGRLSQNRSARSDSTHRNAAKLAFKPKYRLFGLVIAINKYKEEHFRVLRGAEADALSFIEYLESYLQVPKDHINLIGGQNATRSNIIRAFQGLEKDPRIQRGDPIVIFFAGHGGEAPAHEGWEAGGPEGKIQMLIPYDCSKTRGRQVPAIPDRTIGALIDRIARVKGDNITVIFDCCNSASGTRGPDDSDIRVRSVELDDRAYYNPTIDEDILYDGTRGLRPAPQHEHGGLKSHVLLAACGSSELAVESGGFGNFSRSLLNLLRSVPPERLRYCDILAKMERIPNQNPHCEGYNKQRFLFDTRTNPEVPDRFPVRFERHGTASTENYRLVLDAGAAQGIVEGSHFRELGQGANLKVVKVQSFKSILLYEPNFRLDQPSVAELIHVGPREDLRLYIHPMDPLRSLIQHARGNMAYSLRYSLDNVTVVDSPSNAHLAARFSSDRKEIVFDMTDERATRYGFHRRFDRITADVESVSFVLGSACRFFRLLDRARNTQADGQGPLSIQFYQLLEAEHELDESGESIFYPTGKDLCRNGLIDFVVDETAPYGFKLINGSEHDFYASVFYFDYRDLSIKQYFEGPVAINDYKPDHCLPKRRGTLTIGYGSGGIKPIAFDLHDMNVDFGFLKVIFASRAVNFSCLSQSSPFKSLRGMTTYEGKGNGVWDSILIPMIQRRRASS